MLRHLYTIAACLGLGASAHGQAVAGTPLHQEQEEGPVRISLALAAAPEPRPALRYHLRQEVLDQLPGNAALAYKTALMQFLQQKEGGEMLEPVREWLDVPLDELPTADAEVVVARFAVALQTLSRGARYEDCDWQLPVREEGLELMLPHLSVIRDLARVLAVRARLHLAARRYDDALDDIRTGLDLALHVGNSTTLIEGLVGIAVAGVMFDRVEEYIAAPGSPNLYWALTDLSARPMFSFHDAMKWEQSLLYVHAPALRTLDRKGITAEQFQDMVGEILGLFGQLDAGIMMRDDRKRAVGAGLALAVYPRACRALQEQGLSNEEVQAMPVAQVVTRYLLDSYERERDNVFKWAAVPFPQARLGMARADEEIREAMAADPVAGFLPGILLPAVAQASARFADIDRRIATLRCIEALRMHLATAAPRLPATLDEIKDIPLPDDPLTGRPFTYQSTPTGARLEMLALPGDQPRYGRVYELTLKN